VGHGAGDGPVLKEADAFLGGIGRAWCDHRRAAKKRWRAIAFTRGRRRRVQLYRALIKITRATLAYLRGAAAQPAWASHSRVELWQAKVRHDQPLIERIIAPSERRVLAGEVVPASEKLVSLFAPHAAIIRTGREVAYGYKRTLTTGHSGLILDGVIEAGNPADSERLLPMRERHIARYGAAPRQAAADAARPVATIRAGPRPTASATWPSTRKAAGRSKTWSGAAGSIASSATSAPASLPPSRASSGPPVWRAAGPPAMRFGSTVHRKTACIAPPSAIKFLRKQSFMDAP
jgi:hypothetical protein